MQPPEKQKDWHETFDSAMGYGPAAILSNSPIVQEPIPNEEMDGGSSSLMPGKILKFTYRSISQIFSQSRRKFERSRIWA